MDQNYPMVLGVIPARGGSKRFPRKNIASLQGAPLISYTINAVKLSKLITHWLVSSEDDEIIEVARLHGAPVPFVRPMELATDEIRNIDVVLHAMDFMEREHNVTYDIILLLQPTVPIRDPAHIDDCIRLLYNSALPTLASVKGPYQKRDPILKRIDVNGTMTDYRESPIDLRREPFYIYNAAIYGVKRDHLILEHSLISDPQIPYVMDDAHSIDVDREEDLLVAETYLNRRYGEH